MGMSFNSPKTLGAALTMVSAIIGVSRTELSGEQGIRHFNYFLAPSSKTCQMMIYEKH
jgi:anaerobic ribonucleoside-triphosphate reductase